MRPRQVAVRVQPLRETITPKTTHAVALTIRENWTEIEIRAIETKASILETCSCATSIYHVARNVSWSTTPETANTHCAVLKPERFPLSERFGWSPYAISATTTTAPPIRGQATCDTFASRDSLGPSDLTAIETTSLS
jgi:hypothetical protein